MIVLPGSIVMHDVNLLNSIADKIVEHGISAVVHEVPDMIERGDVALVNGDVRVRNGFIEERRK